MRGTYKNPTEDASPAPGGTGLRPSRVGAPPPTGGGQLRRPVPPGAGDATLTGPTLRANLPHRRGGATIPYIYKGIVRSYNNFAGGTKVEFLPPSGEKTFEFLGPLSPRRGVEVAYP